jgi:hypothetical protein
LAKDKALKRRVNKQYQKETRPLSQNITQNVTTFRFLQFSFSHMKHNIVPGRDMQPESENEKKNGLNVAAYLFSGKKMEAVCSPETLVSTCTSTRRYSTVSNMNLAPTRKKQGV